MTQFTRVGSLGALGADIDESTGPAAPATLSSILTAKGLAAWSTGRKVRTAFGGTFADYAAGVCSKIYDQIGSNDATGVASPTQGTGTIGGLNYVKPNGTTQYYTLATQINLTTTDCEYWMAYAKRNVSPSNDPIGLGLSSGTCGMRYNGAANFDMRSTSAGPISYNIQYQMVAGFNIVRVKRLAGKIYFDVNGEQMGTTYGVSLSGNLSFNQIGRNSTTIFESSGIGEILLFSQTLTDAEAEIVRQNMQAAWRFGCFVKNAGSDSDLGWNDATAFQNVSTIITQTHRRGSIINFNKGDSWAAQLKFNTSNQAGIAGDPVIAQSYGTGANPIFDGGTTVSGAGMVVSVGTEYIVTVTLNSPQCAWVLTNAFGANFIGDNVLRLEAGTAGLLTFTAAVGSPGQTNYSPAVGQWAYALGVLHVNVGQDPTGMSFKVAEEPGTQTSGFMPAKPYIYASGVTLQYWAYDGASFDPTANGCGLTNVTTKYNSNDGIGGTSQLIVITGGRTAYNGAARVSSGAAGDGCSLHGNSNGTITGLEVLFNDKAGIDHQDNATIVHSNLYIRGNNRNIYVASISGSATQTWTNIKVAREANDGTNAVEFDVAASHVARFMTIVNYGAGGTGKGIVVNTTGTVDIKDSVTDGFGVGLTLTAAAGLTHDHNDHHDSAAYSGTTAGTGDITSDPLFTNRATADFTLQGGSPCKGAGVAVVSVTTDYAGTTRTNPPSIGAYE